MSEDFLHRVRAVSDNNSIEYSDSIFNEALVEIQDTCLTISKKALIQLGMNASQPEAELRILTPEEKCKTYTKYFGVN